jgi:ABC-2 type transport system permease protein
MGVRRVAVYKRSYRPYEGPLTSERWRFLVLPRFAFQQVFEGRVLVAFLVLCFVPFLVELAAVYVSNTPAALALINVQAGDIDMITPMFFMRSLVVQGVLAFFLTAWVAPMLISPDLVNGALPLYLSRPFTRAEYVLGKAAVLMLLLSAITWVPGLLVFALQSGLAGWDWFSSHLRLPWAIFAGAWVWIAVLTLLGLALSAWIRWRLVASAGLVGVFFMGGAFAEIWREVLNNPWGRVTHLSYLIGLVWIDLFDVSNRRTLAREMLDDRRMQDLPTWMAWTALVVVCAVCLWLLNRRLQAREVVS